MLANPYPPPQIRLKRPMELHRLRATATAPRRPLGSLDPWPYTRPILAPTRLIAARPLRCVRTFAFAALRACCRRRRPALRPALRHLVAGRRGARGAGAAGGGSRAHVRGWSRRGRGVCREGWGPLDEDSLLLNLGFAEEHGGAGRGVGLDGRGSLAVKRGCAGWVRRPACGAWAGGREGGGLESNG